MPARDSLQGQGTITGVLRNGAYRVELANGHRCVAHLEKKSTAAPPALGHTVRLVFHPYDLSRARLVG